MIQMMKTRKNEKMADVVTIQYCTFPTVRTARFLLKEKKERNENIENKY
jgi:hypothetical protein